MNKVGYLLETRAKTRKLRKKPCDQSEMRVKIREIEKKALWSVGDEGKN